jgi:hypothetical protein
MYLTGKGAIVKIRRERTFPDDIVKAGLAFNMKLATASSQADRAKILNYIAGRARDIDPVREHEEYEKMNARMQGFFSQVFWHRALSLEKPTKEEPRKHFMKHLGHLANAIAGDRWRTSLSLCLAGTTLEQESLQLVFRCLPPNLINLSFNVQCTCLTDEDLEMMAQQLPKHVQVLSIDMTGSEGISDNGVMGLVQNLPKHVKTLNLAVGHTQVGQFLTEVVKVESLDKLRDRALTHGCRPAGTKSSVTDPLSLDEQSEQRQTLLESMLRTRVSLEMRNKIIQGLVAAGQSGDRLMMNQRRPLQPPVDH